MVGVHAPSRLHFGFLSLPGPSDSPECWPDMEGRPVLPARRFGGVGLMIQEPAVRLHVEAAPAWSAQGPQAERALAFAQQFLSTFPTNVVGDPPRPHRIVIELCAPPHMGLGSGTQLGLAVAQALTLANHLGPLEVVDLARRVDRGRRSAIGIHGFALGGVLVEAGKRPSEHVAPLVARLPFPESWRIVLILPPWGKGLHGLAESQVFRDLAGPMDQSTTDALCRLVLLGMLPALVEQDLPAFGEALYDFNRRVGEAFRRVQGGRYSHAQTADVVAFVRRQGVSGVGQSSWGPAIFALTEDQEKGVDLSHRLRERFAFVHRDIVVTAASDGGAAKI
jgi:beta-ribofuranosylaminobenzene 5'-phosphate synthase